MEKRIGKIRKIEFGFGGYDDAMIGVSITLGSDSGVWGVDDFRGMWAHRSDNARWTVADQIQILGNSVIWVRDLLLDAHKRRLQDLEGTPIEATFEDNTLKAWRILTEVI